MKCVADLSDLMDRLNKDPECPVCYEQNTLRLLSCQHSLCQRCIDCLSGGTSIPSLDCPMCREVVFIPEGGFPRCDVTELRRKLEGSDNLKAVSEQARGDKSYKRVGVAGENDKSSLRRIHATSKTFHPEPKVDRRLTTAPAYAAASAATYAVNSRAASIPPQCQSITAKLGLFFLVVMLISFLHCHYYHYDMVLIAWYRLTAVITYACNIVMLILLLTALVYCASQINSDFGTIYVCSIPINLYLILQIIWRLEEPSMQIQKW